MKPNTNTEAAETVQTTETPAVVQERLVRLRIPRHLLELRIRSAISDKEMVTAMANRDLQCGDGWRCDYAEWHRDVSKEIEEPFILSANA